MSDGGKENKGRGISVVIPTYNRSQLLDRCLRSIFEAEVPPNLSTIIYVVDNNSSDNTREVVETFINVSPNHEVKYVFEPRQGKSNAINTGITHATNEVLVMIDDDVAISPNWFVTIDHLMRERGSEFDYLGPKILPEFENPAFIPEWIEPLKEGVIVWRDYGDEEWKYESSSPMLVGAACVFKRSVFDDLGTLDPRLGPSGTSLLNAEDALFFHLLNANGKTGYYIPVLVAYHWVPTYRVSKSYFRHWSFMGGLSQRIFDDIVSTSEATVLGVPRWRYRQAAASVTGKLKAIARRDQAESLRHENPALVFAGYFYSKNLEGTRTGRLLEAAAARLLKISERY